MGDLERDNTTRYLNDSEDIYRGYQYPNPPNIDRLYTAKISPIRIRIERYHSCISNFKRFESRTDILRVICTSRSTFTNIKFEIKLFCHYWYKWAITFILLVVNTSMIKLKVSFPITEFGFNVYVYFYYNLVHSKNIFLIIFWISLGRSDLPLTWISNPFPSFCSLDTVL